MWKLAFGQEPLVKNDLFRCVSSSVEIKTDQKNWKTSVLGADTFDLSIYAFQAVVCPCIEAKSVPLKALHPLVSNRVPIYIIICDLASENRPYDIFNPNGVISIML